MQTGEDVYKRQLINLADKTIEEITVVTNHDKRSVEIEQGLFQHILGLQVEVCLLYTSSAEVYYNLGNAYYRTDNITKAVLNYERAHLLSPGDEDISFNLQFARSKTIDKITPESEMFFVTWWKALVNFTSVDCWAKTGIIAIIMALILVLVYLFGPHIVLRKICLLYTSYL